MGGGRRAASGGRRAAPHDVDSPSTATSDTSLPCCSAMKPSTEKMTKPVMKLVPLLTHAIVSASLLYATRDDRDDGARDRLVSATEM